MSTSFQHTGTLKMLIVLCKFSDDTFDKSPDTDVWPSTLNSMPSWGPSLLSPTVQSPYQDPSISGYFKEMSNGSYDVIGDVVFYQPEHIQSYYYVSNGRHIGYLTEEILDGIDPYVNFADYDNNSDNKVDMIQICFRFANTPALDIGLNYQGIAGLTGFHNTFASGPILVKDGKNISAYSLSGSGTFQGGVISPDGALGVMPHEFGHYLFGGFHLEGIGFHGLMDGNGSDVLSSFERSLLGWVNPIVVNSNQTNVTITDAIITSQVWKIQIPNSIEYFLIDNHQRESYYESTWRTHNGGPLVSKGTGILILHIIEDFDYYNPFGSQPKVESAFGKWDWKKYGNYFIYPFEKDTPNKDLGKTKADLRNVAISPGNFANHPDYLGSNEDYFNIGYNQLFSPWSNPSTYPDLSNIGVELLSKNQSNNIIVNFYVNNPENAQPSKPQNLNYTIVQWAHKLVPRFTWDENLEPDIAGYHFYRTDQGTHTIELSYIPKGQPREYTDLENWLNLPPSEELVYSVKAQDNNGLLSVSSELIYINGTLRKPNPERELKMLPNNYSLFQNYPNPFNPSTEISYSLKEDGIVVIKVFDVLGKEVAILKNKFETAGSHNVNFNAANLPSGVYFYSISIGNFTEVKKMVLLR